MYIIFFCRFYDRFGWTRSKSTCVSPVYVLKTRAAKTQKMKRNTLKNKSYLFGLIRAYVYCILYYIIYYYLYVHSLYIINCTYILRCNGEHSCIWKKIIRLTAFNRWYVQRETRRARRMRCFLLDLFSGNRTHRHLTDRPAKNNNNKNKISSTETRGGGSTGTVDCAKFMWGINALYYNTY